MSYRLVDKATGETVITVIDLNEQWTECHRCGKDTPSNWGLPVSDNGEIVPNDYHGEWGGVPACKECFEWHEAWSKQIEQQRKLSMR